MITINSVFKYTDKEDGERIRVVDIIENNIYVVNIDSVTSMPKKEDLKKLEEEIETGRLIKIKDPFTKIIQRRGYLSGNPADKKFLQNLRILNGLDDNSIKENDLKDELRNIRSTADSLSIIGILGIGKTTAIERLLSMYPQVIKHFEYKGNNYRYY